MIGVDHQTVKVTKYQGNDEGSTVSSPHLVPTPFRNS